MTESYTQVAVDGGGRKIESLPIVVPSGTYVTNSDGTRTQLTDDTTLFRQGVAIAGPNSPNQFTEVSGEDGRGALSVDTRHETLTEINMTLKDILQLLQMALEA